MDSLRAGRVGALRIVRGAGLDVRATAKIPSIRERRATTDRPLVLSCSASHPGEPDPTCCAYTPFAVLWRTRWCRSAPELSRLGSLPGPVRTLGLAVLGVQLWAQKYWKALECQVVPHLAHHWHGTRRVSPK